MNKPSERTALFVIGQTTATQLAPKLNNKIIVGVEPDKGELLRRAVLFTRENMIL